MWEDAPGPRQVASHAWEGSPSPGVWVDGHPPRREDHRPMPYAAERSSVPDVAQAFWLRAPGHGEIRSVALPQPGRDEVLVRTLRSGVSRGTEALVFRGGVPPSQYATMRAPFQEGDFPAPVKYGYLSVGAGKSPSWNEIGRAHV